MIYVFKNRGQMSESKHCRPGSLLSVVGEIFEKLVNDRFVEHLKESRFFLIIWLDGFIFAN